MDEMENSRNLPVPLTGSETADAPDWKQQLDRLEAKADRNGRLLRICIGLMVALIAVLAIGFGVLFYHGSIAYQSLLQACDQVDTLAGTIQQSLDSMEPGELDRLLQSLPEIADRLADLDVDALNEVIRQMPALMQLLQELQQEVSQITGFFNGFGGLFR